MCSIEYVQKYPYGTSMIGQSVMEKRKKWNSILLQRMNGNGTFSAIDGTELFDVYNVVRNGIL